ncbi:hypothetical protein [Leucobacter sp. Psy1]|uniref:hypothetical protein n=1 Tax=Leucobacter sp. Psy1 TaxID=2875729 RepID=UPI001CD6BAB8|nr:hypothetical protein [Leucobacter sp. Psy1]
MSEKEKNAMPVAPSIEEIENVLCSVVGVTNLYPAGSVLSRAVALGASAWGAEAPSARVRVVDGSAAAEITVSVGVSSARPLLETLGELTEALAALFALADRPAPILQLTVVHLDDRSQSRPVRR